MLEERMTADGRIAAEAATWVLAARQLLVAGSGHAALAERLRFRSPARRTLAGAPAWNHRSPIPYADPEVAAPVR